jgi:hypothetical protein
MDAHRESAWQRGLGHGASLLHHISRSLITPRRKLWTLTYLFDRFDVLKFRLKLAWRV